MQERLKLECQEINLLLHLRKRIRARNGSWYMKIIQIEVTRKYREKDQEFSQIKENTKMRTTRALDIMWEIIEDVVILFHSIMVWLDTHHSNIIDTDVARIEACMVLYKPRTFCSFH